MSPTTPRSAPSPRVGSALLATRDPAKAPLVARSSPLINNLRASRPLGVRRANRPHSHPPGAPRVSRPPSAGPQGQERAARRRGPAGPLRRERGRRAQTRTGNESLRSPAERRGVRATPAWSASRTRCERRGQTTSPSAREWAPRNVSGELPSSRPWLAAARSSSLPRWSRRSF